MFSAHNTHQAQNAHVGHWLSLTNCVNTLRAVVFHYLAFDHDAADARSRRFLQNLQLQHQYEQDGLCTYKRNIEERSRNHCYGARAIDIF